MAPAHLLRGQLSDTNAIQRRPDPAIIEKQIDDLRRKDAIVIIANNMDASTTEALEKLAKHIKSDGGINNIEYPGVSIIVTSFVAGIASFILGYYIGKSSP
jgi:hypothetical protein